MLLTKPSYFSTQTLPGLGSLQDGGVRANNPLAIALRESSVIWPTAKKHDLLLSVGTGFSPPSAGSLKNSARKLHDGALPRLIQATLHSPCMDGAQGFAEALNYLPLSARSDVLRLDQAIPGPLPELDDITQLPMLSSLAFTVSDELVRTMLASATFFFEMDEFPKNQGMLHCRGSVLCTHPRSAEIVHCVLTEFPGRRDFKLGWASI